MSVTKYLSTVLLILVLIGCQMSSIEEKNRQAPESDVNPQSPVSLPEIIPPRNTPEPKPSVKPTDEALESGSVGKKPTTKPPVVKQTPEPIKIVKQGNPEKGKQVYAQCLACHNLQRNAVGPRHCGVFGRQAGTVDDFDYSDAMQSADRSWSYDTLEAFIADPQKNIPGNLMFYPGINNQQDRLDIIAYLESVGQDKSVCP